MRSGPPLRAPPAGCWRSTERAGSWRDLRFRDLPGLLRPGDLLVFNDTRVDARAGLRARRIAADRVEILLERVLSARTALVHLRASKGLKAGATVLLARRPARRGMLDREGDLFLLEFSCRGARLSSRRHGEIPLPPYIDRPPESADRERYQTVYAREPGAVAAPTAGLHFDADMFAALEARGVRHAFVTLHVGAGTFQPVREDDIERHEMHAEYLEVTAGRLRRDRGRARGGRPGGRGGYDGGAQLGDRGRWRSFGRRRRVRAHRFALWRDTRIFIKPGFRFRAVDAMLTNFHLPESTLVMLCAAFVGREPLLAAYAHAVAGAVPIFQLR